MRGTCISRVRILPRSTVPKQSVVSRSPIAPKADEPSLIRELVARQEAAGDKWPPNLRIETFEDAKVDWNGYTSEVRTALKKFAKER